MKPAIRFANTYEPARLRRDAASRAQKPCGDRLHGREDFGNNDFTHD